GHGVQDSGVRRRRRRCARAGAYRRDRGEHGAHPHLARRPAGRPDAERAAATRRAARGRGRDRGVPRRPPGLASSCGCARGALPLARRVRLPVAAARSRDREQHRRRLPALQQVVQLLLFGARSLMRTLLLKTLFGTPVTIPAPSPADVTLEAAGRALEARARKLFGRAITIREVDAGSCNGCELEIHALNNPVYDVERFGIRFVASPRHADVLIVTGPVTRNMKVALERTYAATPDP